MDLFGNLSYKKQLWHQLYDTREKSKRLSIEHEKTLLYIIYFQTFLNIISLTALGIATLFLTMDGDDTNTTLNIILNMLVIGIKTIEKATGIDQRRVEHQRSSDNFKFISGEVERLMVTKRTTMQLVEISDVLTNMMNKFDQQASSIPSFVQTRVNIEHIPISLIPISPENSVVLQVEEPDFQWGTDYPLCIDHPIIGKYYTDPNNIAHYLNDENGYVSNVDELCCYMVGLSEKDIISPSGFGWVSRIHREDSDYIMDAWKQSVESRSIFYEKYRFVHERNNIVYVVSEGYPRFSKQNKFIGMEGILVNLPKDAWDKLEILTDVKLD